jgi:hypothetical protein
VPQRVAAGVFLDACSADAEGDGALHGGLFEVMPPPKAAARIDGDARGGEDVLLARIIHEAFCCGGRAEPVCFVRRRFRSST